jgi:hypothetical protein
MMAWNMALLSRRIPSCGERSCQMVSSIFGQRSHVAWLHSLRFFPVYSVMLVG